MILISRVIRSAEHSVSVVMKPAFRQDWILVQETIAEKNRGLALVTFKLVMELLSPSAALASMDCCCFFLLPHI